MSQEFVGSIYVFEFDTVEKLKGASNYSTWKIDMEDLLLLAHFRHWIETAKVKPVKRCADEAVGIRAVTRIDVIAWTRAHGMICAILRTCCEDNPRHEIEDHENAAAAWESLKNAYEPKGSGLLNATFKKLESLTLADCNHYGKSRIW